MVPTEGELREDLQLSGEAVRVTRNVSGSSGVPPPRGTHRRSHSEVVTSSVNRGNNFQRWKIQMQRALRWGDDFQEECPLFNPEVLANQKRQWYQLHSKTPDFKKYKEPTSLFEHFIIVGLHPEANLKPAEDAFARKKKWELELKRSDIVDLRMLPHRGTPLPSLEPQILFKYPPGKKMSMRSNELAAFCFPGGVKAHVLERTPSLSELNQLVYGQEHLSRDDFSFLFSLKVGDNATLYGVCLIVREIVQSPPAIFGNSSPICLSPGSSRFLVSAPRCYCVLTRLPFFELHYAMLNSLIAQERLNRITQLTRVISEISLSEPLPSPPHQLNGNGNDSSTHRDPDNEWMDSAIPVNSAIALTAAAAGIIGDDDVPSSSSRWESFSPANEVSSDLGPGKKFPCFDSTAFEASERNVETRDCGRTPEVGSSSFCPRIRKLDRFNSSDNLFSTARNLLPEDEDDEPCQSSNKDAVVAIMEWAKENKNELLQIVCSYHSLPVPSRGSKIVFHPLEHLPAIEYNRPSASELGLSDEHLAADMHDLEVIAKANFDLAAAEETVALSVWTAAAICRALSLETILALVTGVLLEKQVVVICPNLGILSAVVLSLNPIIHPFQWQSLFLPILPCKMLDLLDAPVPFIVGLQQKPADLRTKISNLVYVNIAKDQAKPCNLPLLPRFKELFLELQPIHVRLAREDPVAQRQPVYRCNEVQVEAATQFLNIMGQYMESLCSDLRSHAITSVQSDNDRVSILMKDSFIRSFPSRDQSFVKRFVETQLFSVLSDARLSSNED